MSSKKKLIWIFASMGMTTNNNNKLQKQQIILIMTSVSTQINASNVDVSKVKAQVAKVICLSKTDLRRHCKEQGIESDGSLKAMRADAANRFIDMLPAGKGESAPKLCRSIRQDKWQMGTWILQQQIHEAEKEGRVPPSELCVSGLYDPPGFLRWKVCGEEAEWCLAERDILPSSSDQRLGYSVFVYKWQDIQLI